MARKTAEKAVDAQEEGSSSFTFELPNSLRRKLMDKQVEGLDTTGKIPYLADVVREAIERGLK